MYPYYGGASPGEVVFKDIKKSEVVLGGDSSGEQAEWHGGARFDRKKGRSPLHSRNKPFLSTMVSMAHKKMAAAFAAAYHSEEESLERNGSKVQLPTIGGRGTRDAVKEFTTSRKGHYPQ